MRRKNIYLLILAVVLCVMPFVNGFSQNLPERPNPPRLVNDLAGMLSRGEANRLEQKLVSFNDSTSTQIAIAIVPTLQGYDKSDYAQRLGEKWGVGQKGLNNGLLILVKPKTADSRGEVFIAQGYGLEGAIPDITAAEVVDYEILPAFRNGDYYGGLDKGTNTLMSLARGDYSAAEYGQKAQKGSKSKGSPGAFAIIAIVILFLIISKGSGGSKNRRISTGGLPFWLLMGMLGSGGSHRGSWGGFSGGSGGGGGGFGGFGGGSFGGGGAGGSW